MQISNQPLPTTILKTKKYLSISFDPLCTDGTKFRWNPLNEIRIFTLTDVSDAQNLMSFLYAGLQWGKELTAVKQSAINLLTALALHVRYTSDKYQPGSLSGMCEFLNDPCWDSDKQMYKTMIDAVHDPEGQMNWKNTYAKPTNTHPLIERIAGTMLNREEYDRSLILSEARAALSLYFDPIVSFNTNESDFILREVTKNYVSTEINYFVSSSDNLRLQPLTKLFNSYINSLTDINYEINLLLEDRT